MKISLKTEIFKAAQHCIAKNDVRYYLEGACLRLADGEKGQIHATDGHILFVASFDIDHHEDISDCKGVFDIIIPLDAIKHAAKSKNILVELESLSNCQYLLNGLCFTAIDIKFPDIARVIPAKSAFSSSEISPGQFNPELLVRCHKALNAWFNSKVGAFALYHQGPNNAAIMQGPDNSALCVVMPVRLDAPDLPYNFTVLSDAPTK